MYMTVTDGYMLVTNFYMLVTVVYTHLNIGNSYVILVTDK